MTTTSTERLKNSVARYNKNPSSIQQGCLDVLEDVLDGKDVVDASNPFMFLLEASATMAAVGIAESESVMRSKYGLLANTEDELYNHMSDLDYIGRWATPGRVELNIYIPVNAIEDVAVVNPINPNLRSLVLPGDTRIGVNGVSLAIGYPIQIDILPHGGYQVLYDTTDDNPLYDVSSNIVEHHLSRIGEITYLGMTLTAIQYDMSTGTYPLETNTTLEASVPFTDDFVMVRAYMDSGNGMWVPIRTTHSLQVYDVNYVTAVLEVHNGNVIASIPEIYNTAGMLGVAIRFDIITTKGDIVRDLGEVPEGDYQFEWRNLDGFDSNVLSSKLGGLSNTRIFSTKVLGGGTDAMDLEEFRKHVIYGSKASAIPVTDEQLAQRLELNGFSVEKYNDNLMSRLFIASKPLLPRTRKKVDLPVKASNNTLLLIEGAPGYSRAIADNSSRKRSTLLAGGLYRVSSNNTEMLTDVELNTIEQLRDTDPTLFVNEMNSNDYYFSPFYYVMDYTLGTFKVRPYQLDDPGVHTRSFVDDNHNLAYGINTISTEVDLVGDDYVVTIKTSIPAGLGTTNTLHAQMAFRDGLLNRYGFINNSTVSYNGKVATFTFNLTTTYDVDSFNQIEITSMFSGQGNLNSLYIPLLGEFELYYLVETNASLPSTFSNRYDDTKFLNAVVGATYETVTISFGRHLPALYTPNRSIVGADTYLKHTQDVMLTYDEDVYVRDADGAVYTIVNGDVVFTVEHAEGDPYLDGNSQPMVKYHTGTNIVDGNGMPIIDVPGVVTRQIGILLVSASYRYSTSVDIQEYRDGLNDNILSYLDNDIARTAGNLPERTELKFLPRGSTGKARIGLGGDVSTYLDPNLSFEVTYHLSFTGYKDVTLRNKLIGQARTVISNAVGLTTISSQEIGRQLITLGGAEIDSVAVTPWGSNNDIQVMSLIDTDSAFGINESLVILPNGTIDIAEAIDIKFVTSKT